MKKELTLKELQKESLKILKDVHQFCISNDIMYSVAYGTLIGTIRHKGFIPWDDDIDIIMPRPDYERFCRTYKSNRYKFKCHETDSKHLLAFGRVYDGQNTYIDTVIPWCNSDIGVWIDVFPIDNVSDDEKEFRKKHKVIQKKWRKSVTARAALGQFRLDRSFIFNFKLLIKKILYHNGSLASGLIESVINNKASLPFGQTKHWSQLSCLDGYEYHNIETFTSTQTFPFEDTEVMVMNGYDSVLKECFGDYMKMPPKEEQIGHSDGLTKFYWK